MKGDGSIARNDGVDRIVARNNNLTAKQIGNAERHNERKKESYVNTDIVPERSYLNYHYKSPNGEYSEIFSKMEQNGIISTRGLKDDAKTYGEMIIDVNSAYFHNHGGYEFAKRFYADAYKAAIKIIGNEDYILSAVMHADERNSAMSEKLGKDIYHYHLHIVYIPVVEKEILWSKRCKDESLRGKVKEIIHQVSSSKKWASVPETDENGNPKLNKNGKPILKKSYSKLQDDIFSLMRSYGYTDIERGEKGSTEENLTVLQFKVSQEQERLDDICEQTDKEQKKHDDLQKKNKQQEEQIKKLDTGMWNMFPEVEDVLPETNQMESAKKYRNRILPVIKSILEKARSVYVKNANMKNDIAKAQRENDRKQRIIDRYEEQLAAKDKEVEDIKISASKFNELKMFFGVDKINDFLEQAREKRAYESELRRAARHQRNTIER